MNETANPTDTEMVDYMFGVVEMASVVIGTTLNGLTIPYFYRTIEQLSSRFYLLIVITDIVTLSASFPSAVSMMNIKKAMFLGNKAICFLSGFLFNVTSRMSVFLIALLGLARCISMLFPFRKSRTRHFMVPAGVYFVINLALAGTPILFSPLGYHYSHHFGQCSWGINELSFVRGTDTWYALTYATIVLPWLVPGVVVVLSSIVSIVTLIQSDRTRRRLAPRFRPGGQASLPGVGGALGVAAVTTDRAIKTRQATGTILIMTLVYAVFNMPCWVLYSVLLGRKLNPITWLRGDVAIYLQIFVSRLSVAMNAAANPLIYFSRIEDLSRLVRVRGRGSFSNSVISRASNAFRLVPMPGTDRTRRARTPEPPLKNSPTLIQAKLFRSFKMATQINKEKEAMG